MKSGASLCIFSPQLGPVCWRDFSQSCVPLCKKRNCCVRCTRLHRKPITRSTRSRTHVRGACSVLLRPEAAISSTAALQASSSAHRNQLRRRSLSSRGFDKASELGVSPKGTHRVSHQFSSDICMSSHPTIPPFATLHKSTW